MSELIKRFFRFLLPIFRVAVVQVAADELTKLAYPDRRTSRADYLDRRYHTPYNRIAPRTRREAVRNVGRAVREADDIHFPNRKFQDVLMVAFDLTGPSAHNVHQWLQDNMPEPGEHGDAGEIYLDSWWVANDLRFDGSDTDSAVFVAKGNQMEARALLSEHGLANGA